ncbi:MAG: sulfotransferase [Anaerolineae bacterium]|nr:sulfotransferase [Anaerolineae bacterium]
MASKKFAEWKIERQALRSSLAQQLPLDYASFVDAVYRAYGRQNDPSATRWGDKNPPYAMNLDLLWRLFPDAFVVHIIRDGRAVLNSFRTANQKAGQAIWPESPGAAARFWVRRIDATARHRHHHRYCELFYERLVAAPAAELRRLCDFLQLPYDPAMLEFAQANRREGLVPQHRLAWHDATLQPVQVSNAEKWRQELDPAAARRFELFAGHHLLRYGYSLQRNGPGRFELINKLARLCNQLLTRIPA